MTGMTKRAEIKSLKCLIVMHTKGKATKASAFHC